MTSQKGPSPCKEPAELFFAVTRVAAAAAVAAAAFATDDDDVAEQHLFLLLLAAPLYITSNLLYLLELKS